MGPLVRSISAAIVATLLLVLLAPLSQVIAKEAIPNVDMLALFYAYMFGFCLLAWFGLLAFASIQFALAFFQVRPEFQNQGWIHFSSAAYTLYGQHLRRSAARKFWWSFVPITIYIAAIFIIGRYFPLS